MNFLESAQKFIDDAALTDRENEIRAQLAQAAALLAIAVELNSLSHTLATIYSDGLTVNHQS